MALVTFDTSAKNEFYRIFGTQEAKSDLRNGDKASPKGTKSTSDCLGAAVNLLADIYKDKNLFVAPYASVEMGVSGGVSYERLMDYLKTLRGSSSLGVGLTTQQAMICSIDVERHLVSHLAKICVSETMPESYKKRAKEVAKDLVRKVAIDYRNLCIIMNRSGATPVVTEEINGIDIMKKLPSDKNLYEVYYYVNNQFDAISRAVETNASLTDAEVNEKSLPKDSLKSVRVKASNLGQKVSPNKDLGEEYATIFGGLNTAPKKVIKGATAVAGVVALALVTATVLKSCSDEMKGPEETTTEAGTMDENDTIIGNPADDYYIPEQEPETNAEGEVITEVDTTDYSKPLTDADRNTNKGSSNDFELPIEKDMFTDEQETTKAEETETDLGTEPAETTNEEETTEKYEEFTLGNPADGYEEPEYEGVVPNRGGSSTEDETEDDGFISGRY